MTLNTAFTFTPNLDALNAAVVGALPTKVDSFQTYGDERPFTFLLVGIPVTFSPADEVTVQGILNAHDPVFLTVDKVQVQANDVDTFTVTVNAPRPGAAPVSLTVSVNGGVAVVVPVTLTNGVGTSSFTAKDPGTITIAVQNPGNRYAGNLTVKAV